MFVRRTSEKRNNRTEGKSLYSSNSVLARCTAENSVGKEARAMFYNELDYLDDEEDETICSSKIPTEDELEDNLNKVIDEKLLHSFYLLGKYDVKIERAYREGFRSGLALTISVTALLLSLVALIWKLQTILTLLPK